MALPQILERKSKPVLKRSFKRTNQTEGYSKITESLISESKGLVSGSDWSGAFNNVTKENEKAMPHQTAGQKLDWKLYQKIYNNVGIVKNAVNNTANFAIQSGYELEGDDSAVKKVEEWIDKHNFDLIMLNILKQGLIFGNAYLEFANEDDFKLLPPEQMYVIVSTGKSDNGKIKGYTQIADKVMAENSPRWVPDEIIHFKWNELGTAFYGTPDIRAALGSVRYLLQYLEDVGEIIHRYGHPIIHWKVGTEDIPATESQLTDLKSELDNIAVGEDLITSAGVEGNVLSSDMKLIQLDGLLKIVENQLIGALEVPSFFIRGGESSNKATADDELQAFDRRVKAVRATLGQIIEDKVFKDKLDADVKFAWRELSTEGELDKSEIMANLAKAGVPAKTALKMVGWGSYIDDFEEAQKENDERQKDMFDKQNQGKFGQEPKQGPGQAPSEKEEEYFITEFEPPKSGDAPAKVKKILRKVYDECRSEWVKKHPDDRENKDNKRYCSQVAWNAAKKATGYKPGNSPKEEPKEEDYDTQADWAMAHELWRLSINKGKESS
jgi:hypothetical protein